MQLNVMRPSAGRIDRDVCCVYTFMAEISQQHQSVQVWAMIQVQGRESWFRRGREVLIEDSGKGSGQGAGKTLRDCLGGNIKHGFFPSDPRYSDLRMDATGGASEKDALASKSRYFLHISLWNVDMPWIGPTSKYRSTYSKKGCQFQAS